MRKTDKTASLRRAAENELSPISHLERYRAIVAEFERMACAWPAKRADLTSFCAAAGISRRTLQRACRAVHGLSPHRYLQSIRLAQARRMLSSMDAEVATVTQIAMQCGFSELGRFSMLYRKMFGEIPSETRTGRRRHGPAVL